MTLSRDAMVLLEASGDDRETRAALMEDGSVVIVDFDFHRDEWRRDPETGVTLGRGGVARLREMLGMGATTPAADPPTYSAEFAAERRRQIERYPDSEHLPDGTGGGGRETWERIAKISCDRADKEGRITHTHVFDEETAEVMAATDPVELRKELIQVGAVVCKWIADIDSRTPTLAAIKKATGEEP